MIGAEKRCVVRGWEDIVFGKGGGTKYRFRTKIRTPVLNILWTVISVATCLRVYNVS
jgi:hypothetical protein